MLILYSMNQLKGILSGTPYDFDVPDFFNTQRSVYIKSRNLFISESDIVGLIPDEYIQQLDPIEIHSKHINMVESYSELLHINSKKKNEGIIRTRNQEKVESRYIENTARYFGDARYIVAIDCEFNRHKITELGLFKYDRLNDTFETYHYCLNKNNHDMLSPFRNPYVLSFTKPKMFDHISEIKEDVNKILDSADIVLGYALNNDLSVLRRSGFKKIHRSKIIDVQKVVFKLRNEQLSLTTAMNDFHPNMLSGLYAGANSDMVKQISSFFIERYPKFINMNLFKGLFVHNAFNDALCSFMLYIKIMDDYHYKKMDVDTIEKNIERLIFSSYNENLIKFYNHSRQKTEDYI